LFLRIVSDCSRMLNVWHCLKTSYRSISKKVSCLLITCTTTWPLMVKMKQLHTKLMLTIGVRTEIERMAKIELLEISISYTALWESTRKVPTVNTLSWYFLMQKQEKSHVHSAKINMFTESPNLVFMWRELNLLMRWWAS